MGIRHLPHVLTVPPTKACLLCATPAGMDLYIYIYTGPRPQALTECSPLISKNCLLTSNQDTPTAHLSLEKIISRLIQPGMDLNQKTEFSTADFVGLMPNIEHALELTFAQTIKTKRDGDFHGHLY